MSSLLPWFLFFRCFSIRFVILSFILLFCLVSASVGLFPSILLCVSFGSVTLFSLTPQFLQAGLSLYISFSLSLPLFSPPAAEDLRTPPTGPPLSARQSPPCSTRPGPGAGAGGPARALQPSRGAGRERRKIIKRVHVFVLFFLFFFSLRYIQPDQ